MADVFWSLPPVTRTIAALAVTVSAAGYAGLLNLYHVVFIPQLIFTTKVIPQLWRPFTAFFITKPKFGILLDPFWLYQYGSGLERESARFSQPGDFFVYTMFVGSVIVGLSGMLLNQPVFLQALSLAYAYTYAQDNPTRQVNFFIVNFDAKYLPFAMLFLTFVMESPEAAMAQATGLIAAHLYDFLTRIWPTFGGGSNYIRTPEGVKRWFAPRGGEAQPRGFGTAFQPRAPDTASARTTGRSTFTGPGRRLGD
ncbi:DER1-domain-containing protein [Sporormia fimetaria CBS 119925]|uniref:Derlin n=1 Tax=Sporormia fimetaria CBS 119925 TaxID=1340428 RepID=A0A6A6VD81_9PLEO|nr:DER1-domain-containing protein [Sporormia fimetaria CBS 119925]